MTRDELAILGVLLFSVGMGLLVAILVPGSGVISSPALVYGFIVGLLLSSGLYLLIRPETTHQRSIARE